MTEEEIKPGVVYVTSDNRGGGADDFGAMVHSGNSDGVVTMTTVRKDGSVYDDQMHVGSSYCENYTTIIDETDPRYETIVTAVAAAKLAGEVG